MCVEKKPTDEDLKTTLFKRCTEKDKTGRKTEREQLKV